MSATDVELVIVTGLSGAGRSTTARALQDLGWFVIENLPPSLIPAVVEQAAAGQGASRVAVVVDVRTPGFDSDLLASVSELRGGAHRPQLVFLDAADEVLIRRFDGVRRPHPLQGDGTVSAGIDAERAALRDLRGEADLVVDTTMLNVHELRAKIRATVGDGRPDRLSMTLESFGYKHGLPADADVVVDARLLPNPHWHDELRPLTGLDAPVATWVLTQEAAPGFIHDVETLVRRYATAYAGEGKHFATIAVGCTGGRHRSVTVVEELARRLSEESGVDIHVVHRDVGRE